jgi:hypothetical protein
MLPLRYTRSRQGVLVPSSAIYNIYATDSASRGELPYTFNFAATPITAGSDLVVTNNTELTTAQNTPGKRILVAAGSYNALVLSQDDQDWVVDNGATFAGLSSSAGIVRSRVTGGNIVTSGDVMPYNFEDLILKNVNIECDDFGFGLGTVTFSRAALIQCTVYAQRNGFITPGASASDIGVRGYDLLLAGNYVSGGMTIGSSGVESAFRVMSVERIVQVDNRARCGFDGEGIKHTYRSHYGNQNLWGRRNMTERGDGVYWQARANDDPVLASNRMGAHWWFDYEIYTDSLTAYALRAPGGGGSIAADWLEPIVVDGNSGFTDDADDNWIWASKSGDTIGTNSTAAYQAPPALGSWLTANGIAPGADH